MDLPNPLITISPDRMSGAPCFTGTRVPVQTLFDHLEYGDTIEIFLEDFPSVSRDHAVAVLKLAHQTAIARVADTKLAAE